MANKYNTFNQKIDTKTTSTQNNTKNKIKLQNWQTTSVANNLSVTVYESDPSDKKYCDISSPETSEMEFKRLYKIAMSNGEEYEAWKYAYDMFRKMRVFGKLMVKYGINEGKSSVPLQNCLLIIYVIYSL